MGVLGLFIIIIFFGKYFLGALESKGGKIIKENKTDHLEKWKDTFTNRELENKITNIYYSKKPRDVYDKLIDELKEISFDIYKKNDKVFDEIYDNWGSMYKLFADSCGRENPDLIVFKYVSISTTGIKALDLLMANRGYCRASSSYFNTMGGDPTLCMIKWVQDSIELNNSKYAEFGDDIKHNFKPSMYKNDLLASFYWDKYNDINGRYKTLDEAYNEMLDKYEKEDIKYEDLV